MEQVTEGSCHCASVRVTVPVPPTDVTECRCSICRRYAALWAYYPTSDVILTGPTAVYTWGRRYIGFHHCPACGCVMGWMPLGDYAHCGVNARMLEGFDPEAVTRIVEEDASD